MINYLILDIDGVINVADGDENWSESRIYLLERIVCDNNYYIVVSSSRRKTDVESTKIFFKDKGFTDILLSRIVGVTIRAYQYIDKSKKIHLSIPRGVEIKQWFDTNVHSIDGKEFKEKIKGYHYNYVILDDDTDFLMEQSDNFLHISREHGLLEEHCEYIKRILEPKKVYYDYLISCDYDILHKQPENKDVIEFKDKFAEITGYSFSNWIKTFKNISFYEDYHVTSDGNFELTCDPYDRVYQLKKLTFL